MTNHDKNNKKKNKDEILVDKSNKNNSDKVTKLIKNTPKIIKKLNQHRIKKIVKNLNNSDDYLQGNNITLKKIKFFLFYFHHNVKLTVKSIFDDFVFE